MKLKDNYIVQTPSKPLREHIKSHKSKHVGKDMPDFATTKGVHEYSRWCMAFVREHIGDERLRHALTCARKNESLTYKQYFDLKKAIFGEGKKNRQKVCK